MHVERSCRVSKPNTATQAASPPTMSSHLQDNRGQRVIREIFHLDSKLGTHCQELQLYPPVNTYSYITHKQDHRYTGTPAYQKVYSKYMCKCTMQVPSPLLNTITKLGWPCLNERSFARISNGVLPKKTLMNNPCFRCVLL